MGAKEKRKRTNEDVFKRSSKNGVEDLLSLLYENVLLFCESNRLDTLSYANIDSKEFKGYLNGMSFFEYNDTKKVQKGYFENPSKKWFLKKTISAEVLNNKIIFVSTGNKIKCLLKHIRNAFAHNLIVIDEGNVILGDFVVGKKKQINMDRPTMLGRVSVENFKLIINAIKKIADNNEKKK